MKADMKAEQSSARKPLLMMPLTPMQAWHLQRKYSCGQHAVICGECAECKQKRVKIQRRVATSAPYQEEGCGEGQSAPPIVHATLSSSGQLLDAAARAFLQPRFKHDFSRASVYIYVKVTESM